MSMIDDANLIDTAGIKTPLQANCALCSLSTAGVHEESCPLHKDNRILATAIVETLSPNKSLEGLGDLIVKSERVKALLANLIKSIEQLAKRLDQV